MANIRQAIKQFVFTGKDLCERLRSSEKHTLGDIDFHVLRAELRLVEAEVTNAQELLRRLKPDLANPSDSAHT